MNLQAENLKDCKTPCKTRAEAHAYVANMDWSKLHKIKLKMSADDCSTYSDSDEIIDLLAGDISVMYQIIVDKRGSYEESITRAKFISAACNEHDI